MKAFLAILLAATVVSVRALPDGPPGSACNDLRPGPGAAAHGPIEQASPSPYCVNIIPFYTEDEGFSYVPNCTYNLSFFGCNASNPRMPNCRCDFQYRGFFVQTRSMDDTRFGTFGTSTLGNGSNARLSQCPRAEDGISHNSAVDKICTPFQWTAPPAGTGDLYFRFTAVRVRTEYWAAEAVNQTIREAINVTMCPTPAADFNVCVTDPAVCGGAVKTFAAMGVLLVSLALTLLL